MADTARSPVGPGATRLEVLEPSVWHGVCVGEARRLSGWRVAEYVRVFEPGVRKRHHHETRQGEVVTFMVRLEVETDPYVQLNCLLGTEFDRYVLEHPAFAARIPRGAEIVLQLRGNRGFNAWSRRLTKQNHEQGRPIAIVTIERLRPPRSRLVTPRLRIEAA